MAAIGGSKKHAFRGEFPYLFTGEKPAVPGAQRIEPTQINPGGGIAANRGLDFNGKNLGVTGHPGGLLPKYPAITILMGAAGKIELKQSAKQGNHNPKQKVGKMRCKEVPQLSFSP